MQGEKPGSESGAWGLAWLSPDRQSDLPFSRSQSPHL